MQVSLQKKLLCYKFSYLRITSYVCPTFHDLDFERCTMLSHEKVVIIDFTYLQFSAYVAAITQCSGKARKAIRWFLQEFKIRFLKNQNNSEVFIMKQYLFIVLKSKMKKVSKSLLKINSNRHFKPNFND